MDKNSKIYIAGHKGLVGSAIKRKLIEYGFANIIETEFPPYDLTNQKIVADFFEKEKPEYVFLAAAKVGGIYANNTYRVQFIYDNLMIQNNIIHQSFLHGVKKLLFLGSSCIYPKNCPQPIKEEYLLTGDLEYTNEPYAIAKIAGIIMCESYNIQYGKNFISVMPTNLYGPNDNYNLETSHVLPAMIRKMHLAKCLENNDWSAIKKDFKKYPIEGTSGELSENDILRILNNYGIKLNLNNNKEISSGHNSVTLTLWGTGTPYREFMYVDDAADACIFLMNNVDYEDLKNPSNFGEIKNTHINIGTGKDTTLKDLANLIQKVIGFKGDISWDHSKPDGTFRKMLDVSKINKFGWKEKVSLEEGTKIIYLNYTA